MANVTLRLVKGSPLTNSEVDNNFSNLNIFKTEIGGDLGGNVFYPTVTGIQGRSVANTAPANLQVLSWSSSANAWAPANAVGNYGELQTKPGVNVIITGDVTGSSNIVLANTNTNILTIATTYSPTNFDTRYVKLSNTTTQFVSGPVNFQGNVTFSGNVTTISANNLIVEDNFIYLNNQSEGTNVDFGFAGNYNDGIYRHAGFFRDASDDGTWKVFDQYLPEPDANVNIDTSNSSFRIANFAANVVFANRINVTDSNTVVNLNADLLDGQHNSFYLNYNNANNKPVANILLTGDVAGSANTLLTANSTIITISTTIQANSVALGADTTGNYVGNVNAGANVSVITLGGTEGGNVVIDIPQNIAANANVTFNNVNASNVVTAPAIFSNGSPVWTAANDGAGSGLDADLLDGLQNNYYLNYFNANNKPAANIILSGDVAGSANVVLTANSTVIAITATIQPDSVALGIDTTGNYAANVVAGSGIQAQGGGSESAIITITHGATSSLSGLQGTNGVANITVDGFGHVTAVNTASYLTVESDTLATVTGRGATTTTALTINNAAGNSLTTTGNISVAGNLVWHAGNDGAGSGLDADLLDGQTGTYYTNYTNITNRPAANIVLSGNITGSGNASLSAGTNIITVTAAVADNSVTLGTHTVGRYVANVEPGTAIEVSGGGAENAVTTVSHADTSTLSGLQGGAGVASITVDGLGHVTAVTAATYLTAESDTLNSVAVRGNTTSNTLLLTNSSNSLVASGNIVASNFNATNSITGASLSVTGNISGTLSSAAALPNSGVTAAVYGNSIVVPVITVDAKGRITAASNTNITFDYNNLVNDPAANILLTGDVSGSANAVLTANSTLISINTTIQPNSVALGTDTTGNYTDRVIPGSGITVSGTSDEGNVITVNHADTSSVSNITSFNTNGLVIQNIDLGFDTFGHTTLFTTTTANLDLRYLGLTSKAADADLLDGQDSTYYLNYNNLTNDPAANIVITGDVSGTANAVLTANSTLFAITGTLSTTGVTAGTYGNATIVPVITVDSKGRITNVSNVNISGVTGGGGGGTSSNVTYTSNVFTASASQTLFNVSYSVGFVEVFKNGSKLILDSDFTANNGSSITLLLPAANLDIIETVAYQTFAVANTYTIAQSDATFLKIASFTGSNILTQLLTVDGAGSGLDADLLDGQSSAYYLDYRNLTNDPAANILLTGDVTGSANAVLLANSTVLSATTTLASTGVAAATYGNATIVPVITIDAKGRITSASNVTISGVGGGASSDALANVTARGNVTSDPITLTNTSNSLVASGNITAANVIATNAFTTIGNVVSGNIKITGTTAATSTSTGALVVGGGVGIAGKTWIADTLNVGTTGTEYYVAGYNKYLVIDGSGATNFTAALELRGGSTSGGVFSAINFLGRNSGGTTKNTGRIENVQGPGGDGGGFNIYTLADTGGAGTFRNSLRIQHNGITSITATNGAVAGNTTSGAFLVSGGVGVGENIVLGGSLFTSTGNVSASNVISSNNIFATGNVIAGNLNVTGNITGTLSSSASLPNSGVTAGTYGNATIVPVITIDDKGRITSASNVVISASGGGGGGGPSTDTLADVTARGNTTSHTITITNAGNSLIASGNIQTTGNIVATTGNIFARSFESLANISYFLEPAAVGTSLVVAGNVGIGTINPTYRLEVNGSFAATTKSFDIPHPTLEGKRLVYASLEGPENGVYIRGKLNVAEVGVIQLPYYWKNLVDIDTISVNITPIGSHQKLYVDVITEDYITIGNDNLFDKSIKCFYTVFAERKDVDKLIVEK
jgi:hypothetical protein